MQEAVSDYVELRGLNGLCPDVTKWSAPPGPAAFLDAGLPRTAGAGSLPRGLSERPGLPPAREVLGESGRGKNSSGKPHGIACGGSESTVVDQDDAGGGCRAACPELPPERERRRKKSSLDSVRSSSSIPPPTWEAEGPEGFVSQVRRVSVLPLLSARIGHTHCNLGRRYAQTISVGLGLLAIAHAEAALMPPMAWQKG